MGSNLSSNSTADSNKQLSKSGKHICCVCKETKRARDECIVNRGEEQCREYIMAHNQCLREEGFTVDDSNLSVKQEL